MNVSEFDADSMATGLGTSIPRHIFQRSTSLSPKLSSSTFIYCLFFHYQIETGRLKAIIPLLVGQDRSGFIFGRCISENFEYDVDLLHC
jgi:hypothetical protein